ncbi:Leucine--tRNA ligase [Trichinella spiralis]|uniref:Leucine--tRNA ligase n=1 Tax=Trichinella spiralis TaxID=6334 RepID=A0ABR3KGL2_TRISP
MARLIASRRTVTLDCSGPHRCRIIFRCLRFCIDDFDANLNFSDGTRLQLTTLRTDVGVMRSISSIRPVGDKMTTGRLWMYNTELTLAVEQGKDNTI